MQRGTDIHAETEHYLKTGEIRTGREYGGEGDFRPYVEALAPHLPPPMHDELIIEQRIDMRCWDGGPRWLGFIDIGFSAATPLQIKDIKSTSDFRYAKTPLELKDNIQLNSYGRWVYHTTPYRGEIELGHIYIKTGTKVPKNPKVKPVSVVTDYDYVMDYWEREMETVREMQRVAVEVEKAHDLPPTISACGMYGGCPFRSDCGLTTKELFNTGTKKKGKEMGNSFLSNLKKKAATGNNGVLSPDAPPRTTPKPEETDDEPEMTAAEKKAEKKKAAAEKKKAAAEKKKAAAAKKAEKEAAKAKNTNTEDETEAKLDEKPKAKTKSKTKSKTNGTTTRGFTLYIDCMPSKDVNGDGIEPTLFEDWFSPLVMAMNEEVAEHKKLPSYLLLPYSEEKAMVALAVADAVERLPPSMVVSSGTPGAKDALAGLIPHATKVVRATR